MRLQNDLVQKLTSMNFIPRLKSTKYFTYGFPNNWLSNIIILS